MKGKNSYDFKGLEYEVTKISVLSIVSIIFLLNLSACTSPKDSNAPIITPKMDSSQGITPKPSETGVIQENPEEPEKMVVSNEILNAALYSSVVQIGNTVVTLPANYSDFVSTGSTLISKDKTEDYLMDVNATAVIDMKIGNTIFQLYMTNTSDERCSLKNADVTYIFSTKGSDVFYPLGIKVGDTLTELTDKWGQPSIDGSIGMNNELAYSYLEYPIATKRVHNGISFGAAPEFMSATGFQYVVSIDRNTSQITNIQCKWVDKTAKNEYMDISTQLQFFDGNKYTLSYQIPFALHQNQITVGGKAMTIYTIDNIPYVIVLDANLSGFGGVKSVTDESLNTGINLDKYSAQYEVEIIRNNGAEGAALGYIYSDTVVECRTIYMNEKHQYASYESKIIPLDENGALSESAIDKFKEIMLNFASSVKES